MTFFDNRRLFLATVLVSQLACAYSASGIENPPSKPNIVFIMADDIGYGDLGCYGQELIDTPNIDALATSGIRFTQAYAGGPVCTPSRSVLMTGRHNGHTAGRDNIPHYDTYLEDEDVTVAEVLKDVGYRTGGFGKWSLGDAGTMGRATNQGFDTFFGYLNQDHAHYYYPEYLDDDEDRLDLEGNGKTREHYSHNLIVDRALEFVKENRTDPFFLYCAFTLPHFSSRNEDPDRLTIPSTSPYTDRDWDERSKKYAAMVTRIDRDVGRIVSLIGELGLDKNTIVIFTSDNGGHEEMSGRFDSSGPLKGFKRDLAEGGIRVPFVIRWPGVVPANKVSHEIFAFWDMLPTFAELTGAKAPAEIDGISVAEAFKGNRIPKPHEYLYWDYGHCRDRYDQAVRIGNWKGIRLGQGSPIQLYNLVTDLGEDHDVSDKHPDLVEQIETIMMDAVIPSPKYPIGVEYDGKAIWKRNIKR